MLPVIALHPGKVLIEELLERDWTLSSLAADLQLDRDTLRDFLLGVESLTPELAAKIAKLIGTSEQFWLNLQSSYDAATHEPAEAVESK